MPPSNLGETPGDKDQGNNSGAKSQGGAGPAGTGGPGQLGERGGPEGSTPGYGYPSPMGRENTPKRAADDWNRPSLKRKLCHHIGQQVSHEFFQNMFCNDNVKRVVLTPNIHVSIYHRKISNSTNL